MRRLLLIAGGFISVGLGIIGVVLPILPTTPFLLLAAFCFARSSERFHRWLLSNRVFGAYIRGYIEGLGISIRAKVVVISLLWITILVSVFVFVEPVLLRVLLLLIAGAVTTHVILIRPRERSCAEERHD
jgi:hypothetical protein